MVEKLGEVEISDNEDAQLLLEKLVCILFRLNESLRADKLLLDVVLLFPRLQLHVACPNSETKSFDADTCNERKWMGQHTSLYHHLHQSHRCSQAVLPPPP